jgi:putative transposase
VSRRDIWRLDEVSSPSAANSIGCGGRSISTDDEIVQTRHQSAKRLLTRLLKRQGCPPKRMITDKLGSYAAARRQIMPAIEHRSHKGLNNRAENSHLPLRRRERAMQGFRSPAGLQRFITVSQ